MRAGLLNEIITIRHLSRPIAKNQYGEDVEGYAEETNHRARVVHSGGSRQKQNDEMVYPYSKTFIVRIHVDIDDRDIIVWDNREYRVLSIDKSRDLQQTTIQAEQIHD